MSNPRGFIEIERKDTEYRPVKERVRDYSEVEKRLSPDEIIQQAQRCMDCGVPFCHGTGCPLSNVIPEFNELVANGQWREALDILLSTSNFPEFTGRICPALCEASCTAGLSCSPVTVRQIELAIVEKGFESGYIKPRPPKSRTGHRVAVIGSGPAGLAVADMLNKKGHSVVVYEKDYSAGGLLRYGIPDFKLDKKIVQRRIDLMIEEGIKFETGVDVGVDISFDLLRRRFDAICLCLGAKAPRDLPVPGRELDGIHFAMDFLHQQNCRIAGEPINGADIWATGKKVVVIGGGDTGSDCIGTSLRQGAASVTQIEIMPEPPEGRSESTPWPQWPYLLRTSSSQKEGCERMWNVATRSFSGDGKVQRINAALVEWEFSEDGRPLRMRDVPDSEFVLEADLVLLAMGFVGPRGKSVLDTIGMKYDSRGNILTDADGVTMREGIFAAGDVATGPSLVVRAIAAGRKLAESVDTYLKEI